MQQSLSKRDTILLILVAGVVLGIGIGQLFFKGDGRDMKVHAQGSAEWLYQDTHGKDHGIPVEKFGTPAQPKGTDVLPLANRIVSTDGTRYEGLKNGMVFSLDRTTVDGSITLEATDLTPLDTTVSWDRATMEAVFAGPGGEHFRVVLTKMPPADFSLQTFGGVAFNHLIHGETGLGTEQLVGQFAYEVVQGFADVYKNGERIAHDNYVYIATSEAAHALNTNKQDGTYNVDEPLGKLIVHLVVLPNALKEGGGYEYRPIPTGVIGPDGKEQIFFHVNYMENIHVRGNRFLQKSHTHATSSY